MRRSETFQLESFSSFYLALGAAAESIIVVWRFHSITDGRMVRGCERTIGLRHGKVDSHSRNVLTILSVGPSTPPFGLPWRRLSTLLG